MKTRETIAWLLTILGLAGTVGYGWKACTYAERLDRREEESGGEISRRFRALDGNPSGYVRISEEIGLPPGEWFIFCRDDIESVELDERGIISEAGVWEEFWGEVGQPVPDVDWSTRMVLYAVCGMNIGPDRSCRILHVIRSGERYEVLIDFVQGPHGPPEFLGATYHFVAIDRTDGLIVWTISKRMADWLPDPSFMEPAPYIPEEDVSPRISEE